VTNGERNPKADSPGACTELSRRILTFLRAAALGFRRSAFGLPSDFLIPHPSFLIRHAALSLFLLLLGLPAVSYAQRQAVQRPPELNPAEGKAQARALVAELLAQKPEQSSTNTGQVRIRDRDGQEREIPARFEIICTPTNWSSVYETLDSTGGPGKEKLVIIHADNRPNQYRLLERGESATTNTSFRELTPAQTMIPFAGSDFWVADLGLEFLHWPSQRVLNASNVTRHSKSCKVLESVNPHPVPGGYARVVSWIMTESPHGLVHADAYDARNELLKVFDPVNLQKVAGAYQLAEVEMRNRKTRSHTWIKFDLARE